MNWRKIFLVLGVIFILTGIFLPRDWYDAVPKSEADLTWIRYEEPAAPAQNPPLKGITLLQITLVVEGLAFLWLGWKRRIYKPVAPNQRLSITAENNNADVGSGWFWLIAAVTLLALILRLFQLDSELWLDEITTIFFYGPMPTLHVLTGFVSANNHLLNTLLMKLAVTFFGEQEWAVRLPSAIFGAATIPVFYWVARLLFSRRLSLFAALLLAVSYHHIFYSQNLRGYSMQLFFTTLAGGLLVKGLQEDRLKIWILYVAAMYFNMASILNSGFVFAAHVLIGVAALLLIWRRGDSPFPMLRRLTAVFGVAAFLVFQLYASFIPQAYAYIQTTWGSPKGGFSLFSPVFLAEMIRGISAGFGSSLVLLAFPFAAAVAAVGFFVSLKRQWVLIASFILPIVLTLAYVVINRLAIYPRFFLLALPLAILITIQGVEVIARFAAEKISKKPDALAAKLTAAVVFLGCVVSLASLPRYYSVPKQPYRTALEYVETNRKSGEIIIAVQYMIVGYRFYGREFDLKEDRDYFNVRSVEKLDSVLAAHRERGAYLLTTLSQSLHSAHPELAARIARDWELVQTFPATLGDAQVSVWRQRNNDLPVKMTESEK